MRIVLYNFVQPNDPVHKQGGGVAIYQRNLRAALQARGHEVISLSSGDRYDLFPARPRLAFRRQDGEQAILVNSPVFAPAHFAFHNIGRYLEDATLDGLPSRLRARYGEVDVFHFQNVEGLTAGFLRALRRTFPSARILVAAHNYNLVCPQVNLWYREHKVCEDFREGRACVNCLTFDDRSVYEMNYRRMEALLRTLGLGWTGRMSRFVQATARRAVRTGGRIRDLGRTFSGAKRAPATPPKPLVITSQKKAEDYAAYRHANIELAETVFDQVIAVSERTRAVLIQRGMPAQKVDVSYIGTAHHKRFATAKLNESVEDGLHLAFLGYMRLDKGFFFFLESLFALPDAVAERTSITIAAPIRDGYAIERLKGLSHRFRDIVMHDGYTHARLPEILKGVNLGVVPVLWEDNLPQVAIEFVAHGIPILTSNRGGAQEIGSNPDFIFEAGSTRDFCRKLGAIATGGTRLEDFWRAPPRIFSMEAHVDDLMRLYDPSAPLGLQPANDALGGSAPAKTHGAVAAPSEV